jgi:hypothetical protein
MHGSVGAFIDLHADYPRAVARIQVAVTILTGTSVAPFCVFANGILMAMVGIALRTLIFIDTLTFAIALVESSLTFAQRIDTTRVFEFGAVGVGLARS